MLAVARVNRAEAGLKPDAFQLVHAARNLAELLGKGDDGGGGGAAELAELARQADGVPAAIAPPCAPPCAPP